MRFVLGLLIGLVAGFIAARYVLPQFTGATFETAEAITLSDENGTQLAIMPAGRPVLSLTSRTFKPDTGWWGCLPVLFSDGFQARELLRSSPKWSFDTGPVISAHRIEQPPHH